MSFDGNTAYLIEPADGLEEPVVLPLKRRERRAKIAMGSTAPLLRPPEPDGLECSTILSWPPPSRPPAPSRVKCVEDATSNGIPHEIPERETKLFRCNATRRPALRG